jgi:cellulose synthase/poly-beta-1,6-N-acetylglucosamine synthase-like glycosyltransferase
MFHVLRSLARERMGFSCGLRGNGMCFTSAVLRQVPHDATSLVEDVEYGIQLGEAGYRVHYAPEAHVYGVMVASERAARSQRRRWEHGRWQIAKLHGPRLLWRALRRREAVLFDLAMDVIIPPLSTLFALTGVGLLSSLVLFWCTKQVGASLWAWGLCAIFLGSYVARGWALSSTGARGLIDLIWAPAYILWKLTLPLRVSGGKQSDWFRTTRENKRP